VSNKSRFGVGSFDNNKMDLTSPVIYNDKDIKIRESGLTIKCYYFPISTSKRIPITEIRDVELIN
jgi:hypothetical protein